MTGRGLAYVQYLESFGSGFVVFLWLAALLAVPYLLVVRRVEGGLPPRRLLVAVLFLLYAVLAWAQVLMPFPPDDICQVRHVQAQLVPFGWVGEAVRFGQARPATLLAQLNNAPVVVRIFNVLLLVPLGVFLRRWWGRSFVATVLIGFAVSLSFELTQWTGVWGLYDCAYRLFDVDDLIANTAGAALGWAVASWFAFIPDRTAREAADDGSARLP